jgi:hypothetical protein
MSQRERCGLNVEGDFYVEKDLCLQCLAPELIGFDEEYGCYFKKQPETPEELEHAINAVRVSCIRALRYSEKNFIS